MLVAYVSDERHAALCGVAVEFVDDAGRSWEAQSRASGAVHADLPPGDYTAVLQAPGHGGKFVRLRLPAPRPHLFRLLSDGLLGYAWPKWVRAGDAAECRVHAVEPYALELWRYGWEPEWVCGLGWHDEHGPRAVMQITPDGDYTPVGVGWHAVGSGSGSQRPTVVAPARSGLYYIRGSTASGRRCSFPWVVAPARPTSPVACLAATNTWNAYNAFGGRSNYVHADALPARPIVNARLEMPRHRSGVAGTWGFGAYAPLSFDRPEPFNDIPFEERITDPIEGRQACHLAPAEWRLWGWLEREGFDHDLYADAQLDDGTLDLSHYRVLVIGVHPEYWTRRMYERVKRWVFAEGGRLVYLGGNGLNCEVELLPDGGMVVHNGAITDLWPDGMGGAESRFAMRHESEARLLGVVFTPAGAMTAAPYRVVRADHWVFAGTGLREGDVFGTTCLHRRCPGGASGHETDKVSASSPPGVVRLARGVNPDDGGADMVMVETPSGGSVFSVGSITYPAALPVDDHVSRITANVLRRFRDGD